jgi:hypothetical protein
MHETCEAIGPGCSIRRLFPWPAVPGASAPFTPDRQVRAGMWPAEWLGVLCTAPVASRLLADFVMYSDNYIVWRASHWDVA